MKGKSTRSFSADDFMFYYSPLAGFQGSALFNRLVLIFSCRGERQRERGREREKKKERKRKRKRQRQIQTARKKVICIVTLIIIVITTGVLNYKMKSRFQPPPWP